MNTYFNNDRCQARWILGIVLLVLFILLLASCSSVRKSQSSYKTTSDSTHLKLKDSAHLVTADSGKLQKKDSTAVSTVSSNSTTRITITLDTTTAVTDRPNTPAEYNPDDTTPPAPARPGIISVQVNGTGNVDIDLGGRKAISVQVEQLNSKSSTDSIHIVKTDSSYFRTRDSIHYQHTDSASVRNSAEGTASSKFKRRLSGIVYLAAIGTFFIMLFFIARKLRQRPG